MCSLTSDNGQATDHLQLATPIRRYVGWLIDCILLWAVGPLTAFIVWGLLPVAAPPIAPVCDLECLDKNIRTALDPYASAEDVASGTAGIVLNATAWFRHLRNLFLYALTLLMFLCVGLALGALAYIAWWSITLRPRANAWQADSGHPGGQAGRNAC